MFVRRLFAEQASKPRDPKQEERHADETQARGGRPAASAAQTYIRIVWEASSAATESRQTR